MKILATGTTGFLGKSLYEYFKNKHEFYHISSEYVNKLDKLTFSSTKPINYDILIHIGWGGASNNKDLNSSVQIENIKKSIDLFNFGLLTGVKHFIFFSTSWVYGEYDKICKEDCICKPKNLYGFSKLKVEEIWAELAKINNVKLTIIRPFWIYGPGDKENRFIPTIINKCLKNQDIELNPCLHEVNYLNIDDFCSALDILIDKKEEGIFNVCNVSAIMIKKIVQRIKYLTKSNSNISYNKEYSKDFIHLWDGSCEKLLNLGWRPKIPIDIGLENTIKWHKAKIK